MQLRELEILAPAKNRDIGIAAIDCGADALYIAGPAFGAREAAANAMSDIEVLVKYAHKFGVKVYLTLNTILYDAEIAKARDLAEHAYEIGCDALIIQDLGLLKAGLPPIPLFASTQTNIRTVEQAVLLESLGFKRLILARELSLDQIARIREQTNVELESFVHGALCVSYSGQCYMSSKVTGRSGNRGECAQLCRSDWSLIDNKGSTIIKEKPLLSLKDLNLSEHIPALIKAGITSFKIEGRLKNESYVKNIVRFYRNIIDNFLERDKSYSTASYGKLYGGFTPRPESTFNRGYTNLFIKSERSKWSSEESAKSKGELLGMVLSAGRDIRGNLTFKYQSESVISNGDGLVIVSPEGETVGIRASFTKANEVVTNERASIKKGSVIYRNYNHLFEKELVNNMPKRLIPVELSFNRIGDSTFLRAKSQDGRICEISLNDKFEKAKEQRSAQEILFKQFQKRSSIYDFKLVECYSVNFKGEAEFLFYPVSVLNELRRKVAGKLDKMPVTRIKYDESGDKKSQNSVKVGNKDYRANISNRYSRELYKELGAESCEEAYEIKAPSKGELMRCKYCLKYEMGACPAEGSKVRLHEPLWLENGGKRFELAFDCKNCEMVIFG